MRLLLDTHVFLWWNMDDPRLSASARAAIASASNEVFLSAASAWEIAIKWQKGRLTLPEPPDAYVASRLQSNAILPLAVELQHAAAVAALPPLHSDPFDRLLVSQARMEDLTLVTGDPEIARYGVTTLW
ncbi:MAG: type II toxin-antitoxin system VapC family toxin [Acidobacteria bacterium]|nr:type II toxin-antitoxin system VapC family toxin [Acidobacteriota bacterium]MCG3193209.1 hypothetical protein [Thermoanaerobaculia bacterium]MCK6684277.1 type II toxin-antitoxin system VapC family toxin [Thermoanaerobaculia bacterium]